MSRNPQNTITTGIRSKLLFRSKNSVCVQKIYRESVCHADWEYGRPRRKSANLESIFIMFSRQKKNRKFWNSNLKKLLASNDENVDLGWILENRRLRNIPEPSQVDLRSWDFFLPRKLYEVHQIFWDFPSLLSVLRSRWHKSPGRYCRFFSGSEKSSLGPGRTAEHARWLNVNFKTLIL